VAAAAPTRLRVVGREDDAPTAEAGEDWDAAPDRPVAIPHVLPTMRVVVVAGFAGGVGRTTLAAEVATLVAAHARIRSLDGAEQGVRVLVVVTTDVVDNHRG
jgi:Mrp family chromosome partitioning ATPase